MNRFLKVVSLIAIIVFVAACKKDDDSTSIAPPRDYAVQYATEKADIEEYLHTHYIASVNADLNIDIQPIPEGNTTLVSLWDQQEYPLQTKMVNSNNVDYTVYYMVLNEGSGESPTQYDNILAAYRGTLLDGTQFDYNPFPQSLSSLQLAIEGWREIIPLFKTGTYVNIPGDPNPATYEDFGAGVMFLPSGLAYYNSGVGTVSAYSSMVFSFKLYAMEREDHDNDGIITILETVDGTDPADYDTDGDGTANYLDVDDDNDGYLTKTEIENPITEEPYAFEDIPDCSGGLTGTKKHLDPNCH